MRASPFSFKARVMARTVQPEKFIRPVLSNGDTVLWPGYTEMHDAAIYTHQYVI
jgi:hypothetical protein